MIPFLLCAAFAQAPDAVPESVDAVPWAIPFRLDAPHPWTMTASPRPISAGWLVQIDASAAMLTPRAVGQAVLYADAWPVMRVSPALGTPCALVVVPSAEGLDAVRWFFSTESAEAALPERIDDTSAQAALDAAVAAGIEPMPPQKVGAAVGFADFRALAAFAETQYAERCAKQQPAPLSY